MNLTLKVWRQKDANDPGGFETCPATDVSPDMSFLEMLDVVNEGLILQGREPIAVDSDCREGICGTCSLVINGKPHGGQHGTTVCQLHMRRFKNGDSITIEPWRARAFPILRDLVCDRTAFERHHPGWRLHLRQHRRRARRQRPARAQDQRRVVHGRRGLHRVRGLRGRLQERQRHAVRFGQGVAPGAAPQGKPERERRVLNMVQAMDEAGSGNCTVTASCEAVCPKEISLSFIARMNREYGRALFQGGPRRRAGSDS